MISPREVINFFSNRILGQIINVPVDDLPKQRPKLIRKPLTSKLKTDNMKENIGL